MNRIRKVSTNEFYIKQEEWQVKETTMIVGIDVVGSEKHYFRTFNWRGVELTR